MEMTKLRIFLITVFSGLFLVCSCASRNSIIVGNLPKGANCLIVMPFTTGGEMATGEEELLSEFLASDLFKEGFKGIIYPDEINKAYKTAKSDYPETVNPSYAANIANVIGSDAAVWGNIVYRKIVEGEGELKQDIRLISVEAFLVDARSREIKWYYDSKKTAPGQSTIRKLAQISSEMKWGLLRNTSHGIERSEAVCLKRNFENKLLAFLTSGEMQEQKRKSTDLDKKSISSIKIRLNDQEKKLYSRLAKGERITLSGLAFNGRTSNISKEGILYLNSLTRVLMALGKGYKFTFESHVDATDSMAGDMSLSLDRVIKVKEFLLRYSFFNSDTVEIKAMGGQIPLLPNISKRSRVKNRRVELKASKFAN